MTNGFDGDTCWAAQHSLAHGSADTDWAMVEEHLASCARCSAALDRLTEAIEEQFAAGGVLAAFDSEPAAEATAPAPAAQRPIVPLPLPAAQARRTGSGRQRARWRRPLLAVAGALAAAVAVLAVVLGVRLHGSGGRAEAGRRPEFVPSLAVLPNRPDHSYVSGEPVQVCVRINQPSRVVISVLEEHSTFVLYDADSDPGEHCFPERIGVLHARATLRVDVYYGQERVAREDFPLLPATPTPSP